ncbi:hypothetical protein T11_10594 [Trichinella zimbabwensis]|uniref:Uncharacterized protein n=1 Tax=Trichinella zimbabwensis TaxID=268475 RepID=A0A0V1GYU0_9BILA|nr:hypothetical protein T11_10594 [Trichinella zimbabwensis]
MQDELDTRVIVGKWESSRYFGKSENFSRMDFKTGSSVSYAMLNGTPNGVVGLDYRLVEAQLVISADWSSNIGSSLIRRTPAVTVPHVPSYWLYMISFSGSLVRLCS